MGYKQNLHTHTFYCDGKSSPEEMVLSAIEQGYDSIGFSGHSYVPSMYEYSMSEENAALYKAEISKLKEIYKDKIAVFCGLEKDFQTQIDLSGFDYMIGSVHYMEKDGAGLFIDRDVPSLLFNINEVFNGDAMGYVRMYFDTVANMPDYGNVDIIGHFDLVSKFAEMESCFDIESEEYKAAGLNAIRALEGRIPYFEVNTGAITRGYRTVPYPDRTFLDEFKKCGFGAVLTTDCHNANMIDAGYDIAKKYLIDAGFKHHYVLTTDGFKAVSLFD